MNQNPYDAPQFYGWREPGAPPNSKPSLSVHFVQEAQVNQAVTAETGKQSYDNVLTAYIAPVGMPKSNVAYEIERTKPDGTVVIGDRAAAYKYAEQLKHYKSGTSSEETGAPLRDLVGMTPATAMTLKARGIYTIEMLAAMPDASGGDVMGFWELRDRAIKYLEAREKEAPAKHLEAELAKRDETIASQQRQLDELKALIQQQAPQPTPPAPATEPRRKAA